MRDLIISDLSEVIVVLIMVEWFDYVETKIKMETHAPMIGHVLGHAPGLIVEIKSVR